MRSADTAKTPITAGRAATIWPYRLMCVLWSLGLVHISVGHTVTTYGAGMAVPDWPTTYGYFLLLPPKVWFQHWDVFLAHSHRLTAAIVVVISIAVTVAFWKIRPRLHAWLATAALFSLCLQVILGGVRVLTADTFVACIHACFGPLFFGLLTILVVITHPAYERRVREHGKPLREWPARRTLALFIVLLAYIQVVLLAQLRHVAPQQTPIWPLAIVAAQLILWGCLGVLLILAYFSFRGSPWGRTALWLTLGLYCGHIVFGILAYVVNFNFPAWFSQYVLTIEYTVVQNGPAQVIVSTTFALASSVLFAASVALLTSTWSIETPVSPRDRVTTSQ